MSKNIVFYSFAFYGFYRYNIKKMIVFVSKCAKKLDLR